MKDFLQILKSCLIYIWSGQARHIYDIYAWPKIPQGRAQRGRAPPKDSREAPYQRQRRGGHTENRQHGFRNPSVERRGPETFINNPGTITDVMDTLPPQIPRTISDSFPSRGKPLDDQE